MWNLHHAYIDGAFVPVQGQETLAIIDPSTEQPLGTVTLGNRDDARRAIAAAERAQRWMSRTSKAGRIDMLRRLQAAMGAHAERLRDSAIEEYGAPVSRAQWAAHYASQCFATTAEVLEAYPLTRRIGTATVHMAPVGVAALIAPWNSTAGTVCSKLASAIAAGCATVVKPSELSAIQAQAVAEAVHAAGLPAGVFNMVLGRGGDVGDELATHPAIAKISFTGSTATGKLIARAGVDTMKRVSLALTGKSASVVLDDADLDTALPLALNAAFMNNGQACVAGTRLLVPRARQGEVVQRVQKLVAGLRVGDPRDPATVLGPLAHRAQHERIQHYIRRGLAQGATRVAGGEGRPEGLDRGWYVRPTVFADVRGDMDIARDEIFGPVLSILAHDGDDDAVALANDSAYGLQAYVFSPDRARALQVAERLEAGTVLVNRIAPELAAPFGGVKQSGVGREFGVFGLESFLEAKAVAA
jgi:aldehyde dehydrogenase (NAD+)